MNFILVFGLLIVFVVLAYTVFKILMKAALFGALGAIAPFVANYMGMSIPITLTNILWFALLGVMAYVVYAMASGGVKTMKLITSPFRTLFRQKPKEKIIIREQLPSERQKKR
ncbi:MAG: hypothetical protein KKG13_01445 [Nanoarchaeota archaeon]|nr:hypothetical protein [Nanoarchaeota archaeon]